jgi:hypothetical protein
MNRRNFLRLGALFVPAAVVEPRRVYSFIWARPENEVDRLAAILGTPERLLGETDEELRARIASAYRQHQENVRVRSMQEVIAETIDSAIRAGVLSRNEVIRGFMIKGTISI